MRLLDAKTLRLREFFGSDIPPYAILSHTWGSVEDEVSFQDISNLTHEVRQKPGFQKIAYTAQQAQRDDLDWVWVDTCCIDKTSSAELSEAINSMYNWYNRSSRCYAYLSDVVPWPGSSQDDLWSSRMFENSRWFTRGWTLQELIAPLWVAFYAQDWTFINNKASKVLTDITGIPTQLLFTEKEVAEYSVAQRMSWAANRACTRVEDVAYSLLGLFGINMPLLYGEESKAFERLQEEILKTIDDHSLFASVPMDESNERSRYQIVTSILARSPRDFRQSSDVVRNGEELGEPSQITKHGLRIQLPLRKVRYTGEPPTP
ncbi:heterokaryon incompatibility protein-domain-containing protein [Echria macrotheca]|uniref:Heterokaryon incompatibility protein-domain-containing protein n=1 Tax=Echria macrotheca TaxID=438768 RepID=A0AAJ0B9Z5_9PEZI|nr:heterokaryon incompatibility protein-domain-containing protein [Echria macrotheca]